MSSALYPHSFSHGTKLIGTTAGGTSADLVTAALLYRLLRLSLPLPLTGSSLHSRSFGNSPWPAVLQLDSPLLALPGGHFLPGFCLTLLPIAAMAQRLQMPRA